VAVEAEPTAAWDRSDHVLSNKSGVWRDGSISPVMNREHAVTITSTGNDAVEPSSSGIRHGGNHRSHCAASPGDHASRSARSGRRCSGPHRRTLSPEPRDRTRPTDPLGDHRRQHVRVLGQQRPHAFFERRERRRRQRPLILRRRTHRPPNTDTSEGRPAASSVALATRPIIAGSRSTPTRARPAKWRAGSSDRTRG
jgi:hypothetical protein